ncbi:IPT/TIG domain-containing protein [Actinoplanes sp. NEAU-A12]|uniref:IPT/TIG domain-containing protein n=1 Tax=Actinoplanes sandaracinus TaxID=3045177 RepID=A0ABT6WPH4_9ACTN|nr:IPT/TIG domain-containing protein [Actinoplanes sandaracinus]MDI6101617.1 IPT/TIG domain-containing protein [Actinoplanes sandaracinus]
MGSTLAPLEAQAGPITGTITITAPTNAKLPADTAKGVINLTVSGAAVPALSEDNVKDITLHDVDTNCQDLTNYVVTSATTISIKTPTLPSAGCDVSSGPESIVIEFTNLDTLTKVDALTFVAPPAIKAPDPGVFMPVVTEYSADLPIAQRKKRFLSTGGQTVRVYADPAFAFDPRTAAALKVNLGGKDGTEVKVFAGGGGLTAGTQLTSANVTDTVIGASGTTGTELGNYLTFKTTTGMSVDNDNLVITQNGVSKTFLAAATGTIDVVAGPYITAISPTFGKPNGGTTVTVTASGLDKTLTAGTDVKVFFCGKEATATAHNTGGTALVVTTPDVSNLSPGLGVGTYAGTCPVTITLPNATPSPYTSPLNAFSMFNFPNEA